MLFITKNRKSKKKVFKTSKKKHIKLSTKEFEFFETYSNIKSKNRRKNKRISKNIPTTYLVKKKNKY